MNRRHFVGSLASVTVGLSSFSPTASAAQSGGTLSLRFIGMMGFVRRSDGSLLVATPGHHAFGAYAHTPFLMARAGSRIAEALGLKPHAGVVASAFDQALEDARAEDFVFRCLDDTDLSVESGDGTHTVDVQADQMAQMHLIAKGRRLRNDLQRWSQATVSLHGGRLVNSGAHPDAGRVWTFGAHQQRLTDAVNYSAPQGSVRLAAGAEVRTFSASAGDADQLWIIAAAAPGTSGGDPKRLEHSEVLFRFLVDAPTVYAECAEATGRIAPGTEMPCPAPAMASLRGGAAAAFPPHIELCYNGLFDPTRG